MLVRVVRSHSFCDTTENFSFLVQPVGRKQYRDRLSDNFGGFVAQEVLCAGIPRLNDNVPVLGSDRIAGVLDDSSEFGSGLLRFSRFVTSRKTRKMPISEPSGVKIGAPRRGCNDSVFH